MCGRGGGCLRRGVRACSVYRCNDGAGRLRARRSRLGWYGGGDGVQVRGVGSSVPRVAFRVEPKVAEGSDGCRRVQERRGGDLHARTTYGGQRPVARRRQLSRIPPAATTCRPVVHTHPRCARSRLRVSAVCLFFIRV